MRFDYKYLIAYTAKDGSSSGRCELTCNRKITSYEYLEKTDNSLSEQLPHGKILVTDFKLLRRRRIG